MPIDPVTLTAILSIGSQLLGGDTGGAAPITTAVPTSSFTPAAANPFTGVSSSPEKSVKSPELQSFGSGLPQKPNLPATALANGSNQGTGSKNDSSQGIGSKIGQGLMSPEVLSALIQLTAPPQRAPTQIVPANIQSSFSGGTINPFNRGR